METDTTNENLQDEIKTDPSNFIGLEDMLAFENLKLTNDDLLASMRKGIDLVNKSMLDSLKSPINDVLVGVSKTILDSLRPPINDALMGVNKTMLDSLRPPINDALMGVNKTMLDSFRSPINDALVGVSKTTVFDGLVLPIDDIFPKIELPSFGLDIFRNECLTATMGLSKSILESLTLPMYDKILNIVNQPFLEEFNKIRFPTEDELLLLIFEETLEAVYSNDMETVQEFTINVCGLPIKYVSFVAQALWEKRWRFAKKPLRYIRKVAKNMANKYFKENQPFYDYNDKLISLDQPTSDGNLPILRYEKHNPLSYTELKFDLELACKELNLPKEIIPLFIARANGYTRAEMGKYMGLSQKEVERLWRMGTRYRPKLKNLLS